MLDRPETPTVSDADVHLDQTLTAVGRGDLDAFAALYDVMSPRVYGTALKVLREPIHAEEVVQEVFLQVWTEAGRYEAARGRARSWVMTLAHRRAVDRVRSSQAGRRREATYFRELVTDPRDDTQAVVQAGADAELVRSALATLSSPQRQAIELAYFGGHTHREVAGLMQAPLGTTKTRIRDGLLRLRDTLGSMQTA